MRTITVVGDMVLDRDVIGSAERLCPDAPVAVVDQHDEHVRPGGAGLAAILAARAGHRVRLLSPAGDDAAGRELRRCLAAADVELVALHTTGATREKTRIRVDGHSIVRVDRGDAAAAGPLPADAGRLLEDCEAVLVADYGGGTTALPSLRRRLRRIAADRPVVWDPHPNGQPPIAGTTLVTPNEREARRFAGLDAPAERADRLAQAAAAATALLQCWEVGAVSVTLGSLGALLSTGPGSPLMVPARPGGPGDTCGAGDCYAVTASAALAGGAVLSEAVIAAVAAASAFVAAGGGPLQEPLDGRTAPYRAVPYGSEPHAPAGPASPTGALELAARRRAAGERVVVAGGCFDLLHRGHVELLSAARRLGDCLIVAINSDRSVRQLKGPDRPVMPQAERAAILRALAAVDDVLVFDAASPVDALRRLRPHVFVKGGDYAGLAIEEQPVLAEWGGQVVTVPYLPEYSTTRIVEEVRHA